jgi:hypothetical protein
MAADTGFSCFQWMELDTLLNPIRADAGFQSFLAALRDDDARARAKYGVTAQIP